MGVGKGGSVGGWVCACVLVVQGVCFVRICWIMLCCVLYCDVLGGIKLLCFTGLGWVGLC